MQYLPFIFIFPVLGMMILVTFILSKKGWTDLANKYQYDDEFIGTRIGIISASINGVNYNNSLVMQYNEDGFYLKPVVLFRLFHKPILVPWKEIKEVREKKIIFNSFSELVIGDPFVAIIGLQKSTFEKMKSNIANHNINWK